MPQYYYPYEVVRSIKDQNVAYTKVSLMEDENQYVKLLEDEKHFNCCSCNKKWPGICSCPSTVEEDDDRRNRRVSNESEILYSLWREFLKEVGTDPVPSNDEFKEWRKDNTK